MQQVYYLTAVPYNRTTQNDTKIWMYQAITINQLNEILKKNPNAKVVNIHPTYNGSAFGGKSSDAFVIVDFTEDGMKE